jgi:hypothetical protein
MTAPVVAAVNASIEGSDTTSHTISLPASISTGDLLIFYFVVDGAPTITGPAGWGELFNEAYSNSSFSHACYYLESPSGSDSDPVVTTSDGQISSSRSWRITGHEDPATQAPEANTWDSGGNTTTPDPPSLSPTGGSKDYLFLVTCGCDTSTPTISVYPDIGGATSGNQIRQAAGFTGTGVVMGACDGPSTTATEDPGTFTWSVSRPALAVTLAVHPVGAGGDVLMAQVMM